MSQSRLWDVTVGDPVRVVKADKHHLNDSTQQGICGTTALFEVTYTGQSRSITVGDVKFKQGKSRLISDEAIARRCMSTPGFQARITSRGSVELGRVLTIYRNDRSVEFFMEDDDPIRYDFVVVAPNGSLCCCEEIEDVTDREKARLLKDEMAELTSGEQPYRHKLKMVGKGKWDASGE